MEEIIIIIIIIKHIFLTIAYHRDYLRFRGDGAVVGDGDGNGCT